MPSNTTEYQRDYMKRYVNDAEDVFCPACNCCYKKYRRYRHIKTQKHIRNIEKEKDDVFKSPQMKRLQEKVEALEKLLLKEQAKK
jgi:polyhydroxyalkanoate synthesis regulator phasin